MASAFDPTIEDWVAFAVSCLFSATTISGKVLFALPIGRSLFILLLVDALGCVYTFGGFDCDFKSSPSDYFLITEASSALV